MEDAIKLWLKVLIIADNTNELFYIILTSIFQSFCIRLRLGTLRSYSRPSWTGMGGSLKTSPPGLPMFTIIILYYIHVNADMVKMFISLRCVKYIWSIDLIIIITIKTINSDPGPLQTTYILRLAHVNKFLRKVPEFQVKNHIFNEQTSILQFSVKLLT